MEHSYVLVWAVERTFDLERWMKKEPSKTSRWRSRALGQVAALALVVIPLGSASAAQASPAAKAADESEVSEEEEVCEAEPTLEQARLLTGRDFYAKAGARYDEKDYLGAAKAWEQVVLLMPEKEADLRVQIGHAYHSAYATDQDPGHLRKARKLFRVQLEGLDAGDATRADIESALNNVEAELEALAQVEAEAQAKREEHIRQEQILLNKQALAEAEVASQRKIQKVYFGVGGSATGAGVATLAAMTAFLVKGNQLENEGQTTSQSTGVPDGYYGDQLNSGVSQNRAAWVTGIVGGVLTAAGGSLLIVAAVRQKRLFGKRRKQVAVAPTLGGLQVRF